MNKIEIGQVRKCKFIERYYTIESINKISNRCVITWLDKNLFDHKTIYSIKYILGD
jgi:hypothetical protein